MVVMVVVAACSSGVGAEPDPSAAAPTASSRSADVTSAGPPATPPTPGTAQTATSSPSPHQVELPRGGRKVFPRYRLVGYAGLTGASTWADWAPGRWISGWPSWRDEPPPTVPGRDILLVLEVITTIVQGSPGRDGTYRVRINDDQIKIYLRA